jgi:hypothetical protein
MEFGTSQPVDTLYTHGCFIVPYTHGCFIVPNPPLDPRFREGVDKARGMKLW